MSHDDQVMLYAYEQIRMEEDEWAREEAEKQAKKQQGRMPRLPRKR